MLCFSVPPGYRRTAPVRRPKLDGFTEIIDQWLKEDLKQLRKQRHTAKRIFDRLRAEHGFSGGYTIMIVKDYVREHHRRRREMFVPLTHPPGHGQADFGEARAVIGGVARKAHFFVFDLPHSDACYVRAYPAATAEAWIDGHVHGLCCKPGRRGESDQDDNRAFVMFLRWPDGPLATPSPRSERTVRDRRRARRSGPRRQCRPGGRTSRPGPCAARASPRSP